MIVAETFDYDKLGHTSWRATVALGDEHDPWRHTLAEREIRGARSKGLAVGFVNQRLAELHLTGRSQLAELAGGYYWGRVERGTYLDASFDDDEHGWIHDAIWKPDHNHTGEPVSAHARLDADGTIVWSQP